MFDKLKADFDDKDIQWRVTAGGIKDGKPWALIVPYIDSRTAMDRLDAVVGPDKWTDEYSEWGGGVKCRLSIQFKESGMLWVHKEDGSEKTDIEGFKGGFSKALVRAAVKWGIGRYLYDMPKIYATPCDKSEKGSRTDKIKGKNGAKDAWLTWKPPKLRRKQ